MKGSKMTTSATTATVETLTAEVRTLVVGSRQITMSVAKQVDVIPLAELNPFGRINIGGDLDWVIGSHTETGALCRSNLSARIRQRPIIQIPRSADKKAPIGCFERLRLSQNAYQLRFVEWPIELVVGSIDDRHAGQRRCHVTECTHEGSEVCRGFHCTADCDTWDPRDSQQFLIDAVIPHRSKYISEQWHIDRAKAMPLIVLAGLR